MNRRSNHRWVHVTAVAMLVLALGVTGSCRGGGGVDSDADGLLDEWETRGLTNDPDGRGPIPPRFINLPAMGADKEKPDIFVQIDWMADTTHSHALTPAAIRKVVDAFKNSPYGSAGINLHVDEGPSSIMNFATNETWGSLSQANQLTHVNSLGGVQTFLGRSLGYDWGDFQKLKNTYFTPTGRSPVFHYALAAHTYPSSPPGSSGLSRGAPGSDLIISLGDFIGGVGTENDQAGTLMHELGHNLGLGHGGGDKTNYKPNYLSIMNYGFQFGLIKGGVAGTIDYSRSKLPSLDENSLSEPVGIGAVGYGTRHSCQASVPPPPATFVSVSDASGAIDWNCAFAANQTPIKFDINGDGGLGTLNGYDDWANLNLKGGAIGQAGAAPDLPMITENDETMTPAEARKTMFSFAGFEPPVANPPALNVRFGGFSVPIRFSLGGDFGLDIFAAGSPYSQQIGCDTGVPVGDVEQAVGPGQTTLMYHPKEQYTYLWETTGSWSGTCRRLTLAFIDGTQEYAIFGLQNQIT